jgi:peptidyl-prolyl cis-trans isomerase D
VSRTDSASSSGFFSPITGAFDRDTYVGELGRNGLTPERFESELRDNVAQQHFVAGVVAGMQAPRAFGAAAAAFESEIRDVSLALVHPGLVERPAPPTDAQLNAFLRENASALRRPELRALTVVRFNAADIARSVVVDPAEVQRQFEFRRESLSQPERRTFVQAPAPDQASAAQVARRLGAGEDPAAVARSISRDLVPFDNTPRSAVTDPALAQAAFSLPVGGVSAPIQGRLGWSVIKVVAITPAVQASLDAVRTQIETEIRNAAAEQQVDAAVARYEEAHSSGANLVEAARQAGVATLSLAPVSAEGRSATGAQIALEPALLQLAFDTAQGAESDIQELAPGQYAAVRVDRVIAPALPPMEEIRAPLTNAWLQRELRTRVGARAQSLAATVRQGGSVQSAAASANAPFNQLPGLSRAGGAQTPPEVLGPAFSGKRGEVFVTDLINTPNGPLGIGVGRIEAVRFPPAPQMAATVIPRRQGLTQELFQDIGEAVRGAARSALKVRTNPERALAALASDPAAIPDRTAVRRPERPPRVDPSKVGLLKADRRPGEAGARLRRLRRALCDGRSQVVWTRLIDDLQTPVSAFLKVAAGRPYAGLLESVEGGAFRGRYSILTLEPDLSGVARRARRDQRGADLARTDSGPSPTMHCRP